MDWLAGILELFGGWLVGNKKKIGFISNILGCSIWIYVALTTHVYGLLIVVIPALFVNTRNYIKWRREGMGKKRFKEKKYLEAAGNICPYCLSDDVETSNAMGTDVNIAWRYVDCYNCGSEWKDLYKLVGAEEVENNT